MKNTLFLYIVNVGDEMAELINIKGIGKTSLEKLKQNRIMDVEDLVKTYPSKYRLNEIKSIHNMTINEEITLEGTLTKNPLVYYIRKKLTKMKLQMLIEDKSIDVSIFNREFLKNNLSIEDTLVITGRFQTPSQFLASDIVKRHNYLEGIIPEYKLEGLSSKLLSKWIDYALQNEFVKIEETLPEFILKKNHLPDMNRFFQVVHHPNTLLEVEISQNRIKYEELISFFLKLEIMKQEHREAFIRRKTYDIQKVKDFISTLPFVLTEDQKAATNDIFRDLKSNRQMNRLLQGDTGSGKTVCAAIAIYAVITGGEQVALMAPTELLAIQHEATLKQYLDPFHVKTAFLSSSVIGKERESILQELKNGKIDLLIGTHSLIQENVAFHRLGFVVIDEQHRFGVNQRKSLRQKGLSPDVLFMSATPIPRTLAITIFKDMDISSIHSIPPGRPPIITEMAPYENLNKTLSKMEEEIKKEHQCYVIVPLIQENEESNSISIDEAYMIVSSGLPKEVKIGVLHGKMKSQEKENVLNLFYQNKIQVLVSTTVVEVGLNVPNATFMTILNANRFGLSQLHQLRGRVRRSQSQAYCHLIHDGLLEDENRLEILCKTNDGFEISEADLKYRGPGQIFGEEQTGIPRFKMANFVMDQYLIQSAIEDASEILKSNDPKSLAMRNRITNTLDSYHLD